MKLKEGLAQKYFEQVVFGSPTDTIEDHQLFDAYVVGFEKAVELTIALLREYDLSSGSENQEYAKSVIEDRIRAIKDTL